jgi:branched-chain amino acid aminotransferase
LWLDGAEHRYVEEVGTSNIFFRIKNELVTPALMGSILPGVTRDSVIQLARHWGITCIERAITIDEVIDSIRSGGLKEIFATGTAAVISPVGEIFYKERMYTVGDGNTGVYTQKLYDEITGIQHGEREDIFGWMRELNV